MPMLADLQKLAGRKLIEGRRRAGANIDRWEAMVSQTRQLAKEAEVAIETPQQLLTDIARARSELMKADYLAALKIGERASDAEMELKGRAKDRLASAERERAATVATIRNDIVTITARKDGNCTAASNAKQAAMSEAERIRTSVSAPYFDLKEKAGIGCITGVMVGIGWLVVLCFTEVEYPRIFKASNIVLLVFGIFGWLTVPILAAISNAMKHAFRQSEAGSNAATLIKKSERSLKTSIAHAEKDFARDIVAPRSALPKAEAHWQKAVQAINRLPRSN